MKFALSKRRIITLTVILLVLLGLYSFHEIILARIGAYPVRQSVVAPSDLIVVVSGTLPEVHYGIDLYKAGYAPKLLFVGHFPVELAVLSKEPFELVEKPWDVIAGHMATSAGVPETALLFADAFTDSTYERVVSFIDVARQHDVHSMIVVSDLIHSRRIAESAAKITGAAPLVILSAPTPLTYVPEAYRFNPDRWWTDEQDLKEVVDELIKLAFYWVKYRD